MSQLANIANPDLKKPKTLNTELDIRLDSEAKEARLIIPASQLRQLRAELEQLDGSEGNTAAAVSTGDFSRTQAIMSGLFLSLAFVFGGILFVRSGKSMTRQSKTLVVLAMLAVLGSAVTFVNANAGPPSEARSINGKMFSQAIHLYGFGWGKIKLEAGDGDRVKLIVPNPKTAAAPAGEE